MRKIQQRELEVYKDEVVIERVTTMGQSCGKLAISRLLLPFIIRANHEYKMKYEGTPFCLFYLVEENGTSRAPTVDDYHGV